MRVNIGRYPSARTLKKNPDAVRKVDVRIDKHDTWNLDYTLAYVVHPMLVQLRDTNHGYGEVDLDDVPEHLKGDDMAGEPGLARWLWVMDEMIWAFDQCKSDWEETYWVVPKGQVLDIRHWDRPGHEAHFARMKNGLRLFGKYYFSLWD
jgi:hypothetical protein